MCLCVCVCEQNVIDIPDVPDISYYLLILFSVELVYLNCTINSNSNLLILNDGFFHYCSENYSLQSIIVKYFLTKKAIHNFFFIQRENHL